MYKGEGRGLSTTNMTDRYIRSQVLVYRAVAVGPSAWLILQSRDDVASQERLENYDVSYI